MMFTRGRIGLKSNTDLPTEVKEVVKGTARRIIVVKSPDKRIFEEAIFIVREDYLSSGGISRAELLNEAREAARGYVSILRHRTGNRLGFAVPLATAVFGSGIAVAVMKIFGL